MAWLEKVSDAVYEMLCAAFHVSPDSPEGMRRFAPAYIFETTTPQADRNVNVCYYDIRPASNEGFRYIETAYAKSTEADAVAKITRNIPVTVLCTFYGPNADDDSEHFWALCQTDVDNTSPRTVLRRKKIVLDGKPEFPVGVDQVEGTFIRRRCDVRLNLVLYDVHAIPYGTVEHVPETETAAQVSSGIIVQY